MKKIVRLTERDLALLVKKVIKETESISTEEVGPEEVDQFERDLKQIEYKLGTVSPEPISDIIDDEDEELEQPSTSTTTGETPNEEIRSIIQKRFDKKLSKRRKLRQAYEANKEYVDGEKEQLLKIFDKNNLCTKEGRRSAIYALKNKVSQYLQMQSKNKSKNIEEQYFVPPTGEQWLLLVGTLLVILVLIFWKSIIYGDGCRRYFRRRESWRY